MRGTDDPPRQKKVFNVTAVETAERNSIDPLGVPLGAARKSTENTI
jgi:hypothetical protein